MSDETPDTTATPPEAPHRSARPRTLLLVAVAIAALVVIVVAVVAIGQFGPGEAEAPSTPRPTPVAEQPHPDAPQITEFVMVSEEPRIQCLEPGKISATLELRWTSSVDNEETELWGYAIGRNSLGSGLSSNTSRSVPISCATDRHLSFFVVVHDGEHSASAEVVIEPAATPRVDAFTVEVAGAGSVADACASAGAVALDVRWATFNAERVDIDRVVQPGAVSRSVGADVLYTSRLETEYDCSWTSAEYTITVTDRGGATSISTVTVSN